MTHFSNGLFAMRIDYVIILYFFMFTCVHTFFGNNFENHITIFNEIVLLYVRFRFSDFHEQLVYICLKSGCSLYICKGYFLNFSKLSFFAFEKTILGEVLSDKSIRVTHLGIIFYRHLLIGIYCVLIYVIKFQYAYFVI